MERLYTRQLDIGYADDVIVQNLNLSVPTGKITALVGANGSGKSTILKTMARIMKPKSGYVILDGKAIHGQPTKAVAKQLAILPKSDGAGKIDRIRVDSLRSLPASKRIRCLHPGRQKGCSVGTPSDQHGTVLPSVPSIGCPEVSVSGRGSLWHLLSKRKFYFWTSRPPFWTWLISWKYCIY